MRSFFAMIALIGTALAASAGCEGCDKQLSGQPVTPDATLLAQICADAGCTCGCGCGCPETD